MQIKWGNAVSALFHVNNGILSTILFNVYMDDRSKQFNGCNTGCLVGNSIINHLMYADDLLI